MLQNVNAVGSKWEQGPKEVHKTIHGVQKENIICIINR